MVVSVTIWHNPRCSKSRQTLALLEDNGVTPEVRLYLKDPPTKAELDAVIAMLGNSPKELVRKGDAAYREAGLTGESSDDDILAAMLEHPILIERPIVINGDRAAVGRPPESILSIL